MAGAVRGAARAQGAAADVSALRCRADWAGRAQERRADGVAMGAGRRRPVASFHCERVWSEAPLEEELAIQADKLIGGANAVLVVDDTDAGGRANAIFPISSPRRLKTVSPPRSGEASAGVKEPKDLWRPPSPPCACGSPMVRPNASMTRPCSTCRARRPGWSASGAPRASANPIFPTCLKTLAGAIKARWVCEQAHQQLKQELGLDHFEGRSWRGLHRHALMTMIAYAYLQSRRLAEASGGKKSATGHPSRRSPRSGAPCSPPSLARLLIHVPAAAERSVGRSNKSAKVVLARISVYCSEAVATASR